MAAKLYVANLSTSTDDQSLEDHFKDFGDIQWCQVVKDRRTNSSKRYGFVTFKEEADGDKAVAELNGSELDGSKIEVEYSKQGPKGIISGAASGENLRLFVGGLPVGVTEEDLMELFNDCDPEEAFICKEKHPPCGFITLKSKDEETLEKAMKQEGIYFKNSEWRLQIKPAKPPQRRGGRSSSPRGRRGFGGRSRSRSRSRDRGPREVRFYVAGIPEGVKEDDLIAFFDRAEARDAFIPPNQPKGPPFYGFVGVKDEGSNVKYALAKDGEYFDDKSEYRLSVSFSKPRRRDGDRGGGRRGGGYGRGRSRSPSPYYRGGGGHRGRSRSPSYERGGYRRSPSYSRSPRRY